jgi:cytoskeleton protein RodZ
MTDPTPTTTPAAPGAAANDAPRAPASAGAMLRAARDAAGMSLDTVAQQLKLAPRQVTALEDGNYAALPGRTFVRGFLRNYARLVRLDPEVVLAALPGRDAPSLDSPALQPTAPTMGELPNAEYGKPSWTRWAIPLTLVAVIAIGAIYEFSRSHSEPPRVTPPAAAPEPERAPAPAPANTTAPAPGPATQTLPNPVAGAQPAGAADATPAATTQPASAAAPVAAGEPLLVIVYQQSSWTQVKDGSGNVLLAQTVPAGETRSIAGTPPFDVVIGIASAATVTFRGKPIDLVPHTRQKVARLVLQ